MNQPNAPGKPQEPGRAQQNPEDQTLFQYQEMPVINPTPKGQPPPPQKPKPVAAQDSTLNDAQSLDQWVADPKKMNLPPGQTGLYPTPAGRSADYGGNYSRKKLRKPLNAPQEGHTQTSQFQVGDDEDKPEKPKSKFKSLLSALNILGNKSQNTPKSNPPK